MIFVVPILMSALTLILKSSVSRWANRIIGILYALITFAFWFYVLYCDRRAMSSFGQRHNSCLPYWLSGTVGNGLTLKVSPENKAL